jgi:hypothetical protein
MDKLFILMLKDNKNNYDNILVKIYAKDIQEVQDKLKNININKLIGKEFEDKNYDFYVSSYYDIDLMTEIK